MSVVLLRRSQLSVRSLAAVLLATSPGLLRAADVTWYAASGNYFDSSNWIGGVVPTATDNVFFNNASVPSGNEANVFQNGPATVTNLGISNLSVNWAMAGDFTATQTYLNGSGFGERLSLSSQDGLNHTWNTGSFSGFLANLEVGANVTLRTSGFYMQGADLTIAEGAAVRMVADADGHSQAARFNSFYSDSVANIHGEFESTGLIIGSYDYGLGTKPIVNIDGANASLVDHGQDDGGGSWQPSAIGRADSMPVYGELDVSNGAKATFEKDLVVGWGSTVARGEGLVNVQNGTFEVQGDLSVGYTGGKGTLTADGSTINVGTLRLGDHQGTTSIVDLKNTTATIGNIFVGGTDPFGSEISDTAHMTLTDSTLNVTGILLRGHENDDYRFNAVNSEINTVLLEVEGGTYSMVGGTLNVQDQAPNFSGLQVRMSDQGVTPSLVDLKNLTANVNSIVVGDSNTTANGGALLKMDNVVLNTKNGAGVGNYAGGIGDAGLDFNRVTMTGDQFSAFAVGRQGNGDALVTSSTLDNDYFFVGDLAQGVGNLELHDTTVTARHQDTGGFIYEVAIGSNNGGVGVVDLYNSTISAEDVHIGTGGTLKGSGLLNGSSLNSNHFTNVVNDGIISPGHSPGKIAIDGNLKNNGKILMEIDLSDPTQYDQLDVSNLFTAGGTLELRALGTGTWDPTRTYNLITFGSMTGIFSNIVIDSRFTGLTAANFSVNGNVFGINPQPVPEPASLLVLGLGALAMRRRKRA